MKRLSDANQKSKAGISLHETKIKEVNYFKASPESKSITEFEDRAKATGTTPVATMVNSKDKQNYITTACSLLQSNLEPEDGIICNVEINNMFEVLSKPKHTSTTDIGNKPLEPKFSDIDHVNYKEFFRSFLKNFKDGDSDSEAKYPKADKHTMKHVHNMFQISLLDLGIFNLKLRGFIAAEEKNLSGDIRELVKDFGEQIDPGGFKNGLSISINKKNYGQ